MAKDYYTNESTYVNKSGRINAFYYRESDYDIKITPRHIFIEGKLQCNSKLLKYKGIIEHFQLENLDKYLSEGFDFAGKNSICKKCLKNVTKQVA